MACRSGRRRDRQGSSALLRGWKASPADASHILASRVVSSKMGSRMEDNKGLGPSTTHVDLAVSTQDTAVGLDSDELLVPRRCTLDGFAEEAARQGGVDMGELPTLTRLHVRTQNTVYQLILLSPGESKVLIQGGRFFAEPTESYLCGSSYGGNLLKVSWVGLGMRIEVMREGRRIVTSIVQSVHVVDDSDIPGPF